MWLLITITAHEVGHFFTASMLNYKIKVFIKKGDFVMKFPDMPKKHTKAILLSGVIAGLIVAIMSYFEIGLFSLGLIVISILGSSHDLSIIFGGKKQ